MDTDGLLTFKVVTFKGNGRQPWRYKLVGLNGETLVSSEGYLTRWNRDRAVAKAGFEAHGVEIVNR